MYHLAKGLYLYATSKEEYSILLLGLDNAGKTTFLNQIKALYLPSQSGESVSSLSGIFSSSSSKDNDSSRDATTGILGGLGGTGSSGVPNPGQTVPTVGQNVSTIPLADMYLKIWDVGGQHSLRRLWQSYYASCHAIVFVIDSTDVGDGDISRLALHSTPAVSAPPSSAPSGKRSSVSSQPHTAQTKEQEEQPLDRGRLDECRLVLEDVLQHSETEGVPLLVLANKQDREDCVEVVRIKEGLVRKVFEGPNGGGVRDSRVLPVSALTGVGVKEAVEWICTRVKWNREGRPPVMR